MMVALMSKDRDEFFRSFQRAMLNDLTANDGENLRQLIRDVQEHGSQSDKRNLHKLINHPALKHLVAH
jgi:hypothetical protein